MRGSGRVGKVCPLFGVGTPELELSYQVCEGQSTPPSSVFERTIAIPPTLIGLFHHPSPSQSFKPKPWESLSLCSSSRPFQIIRKSSSWHLQTYRRFSPCFHLHHSQPCAHQYHLWRSANVSSRLFSQVLAPLTPTVYPGARDDPYTQTGSGPSLTENFMASCAFVIKLIKIKTPPDCGTLMPLRLYPHISNPILSLLTATPVAAATLAFCLLVFLPQGLCTFFFLRLENGSWDPILEFLSFPIPFPG